MCCSSDLEIKLNLFLSNDLFDIVFIGSYPIDALAPVSILNLILKATANVIPVSVRIKNIHNYA